MTKQTPARYRAQERYRAKQAEQRDMVRVSIWIPEAARDQVMKLADKLRKAAKRHGEKT